MTPFSNVSAISQPLVSTVPGCVGIRKSRNFSRSFLAESRMLRPTCPREPRGLHQSPQGKWGQKQRGGEESGRPWHLSPDMRSESGRENERHSRRSVNMLQRLTRETVRKLEAHRKVVRPVTWAGIDGESSREPGDLVIVHHR